MACRQVFPDLAKDVDQTMQPVRAAAPGCVAEYEREGPTKDRLTATAARGSVGLHRNKMKFCETDLREGVGGLLTLLKK